MSKTRNRLSTIAPCLIPTLSLLATVLLFLLTLVLFRPAVNAWEKAHNFPYGQMCDSIFTNHVNTCPR